MYDEATHRISTQDTDSSELALSVLFWIASARRPLTVQELQHLYAIEQVADGEDLDQDDLPDGDILTAVCGGLITVESDAQLVHLIHYSAQEYFERARRPEILTAKESITLACFKYLRLPAFASGICSTDVDMEERLRQYALLDYASKHWGAEAADLEPLSKDILESMKLFVNNAIAVSVAGQAWGLSSARHQYWSQEFARNVPALVLAAAFSVPGLIEDMIDTGHSIDDKGSDGETALVRASRFGHTANVKVLVALGADVHAKDYTGETALDKAALKGNTDVMLLLIQQGLDVNTQTSYGWTVLMSAVVSERIEAVRLLVEAGAIMETETSWGDSALSLATRNGLEDIANFLANKGAILPRGPAGRRASLAASRRGYHQLVQRLTADYNSLAQHPLQRQGSVPFTRLPAITGDDVDDHEIDMAEFFDKTGCLFKLSSRYHVLQKLGRGHFAEVFMCANKVTNLRYAVKIFPAPKPDQRGKLSYIRKEIESLKELSSHPNITRFVNVFFDSEATEFSDEHTTISIVLELSTEGELFNFIVSQQKQKLSQDQTRRIFTQLFSVTEFLVSITQTMRVLVG